MYQEAVKVLCQLMRQFPDAFSIEVIDDDLLALHYDRMESHKKEFKTMSAMVEWMEENLNKSV